MKIKSLTDCRQNVGARESHNRNNKHEAPDHNGRRYRRSKLTDHRGDTGKQREGTRTASRLRKALTNSSLCGCFGFRSAVVLFTHPAQTLRNVHLLYSTLLYYAVYSLSFTSSDSHFQIDLYKHTYIHILTC